MTDAATGKLPIVRVVGEAWSFMPRNGGPFVIAAVIVALLSQVGVLAQYAAGMGQADASGANLLLLLAEVPGFIGGLMFSAAILRKAVRDTYLQPFGLTLGKDEFQILATGISMVLLAIPAALILSLIISAPIAGSAAGDSPEAMEALASNPSEMGRVMMDVYGPVGLTILAVVVIALISLFLGLLAFVNAATIGEGRIMIFQALVWMRGNILRACAAIVLAVAPAIVLRFGVPYGLALLIVSATGEGGFGLVPFLVATTLGAFISFVANIPINALGAVLYKGLRPETSRPVFS